jgi:fructokinase
MKFFYESHFTTLAFVSLMLNGEIYFYFNRGAYGALSLEDIENIPLHEYAIIHFGSATAFLPAPLQTTYKTLLQKASANNIFISFDPNYRHLLYKENIPSFISQAWHFITHCHFFKLSEEEALLITGASNIADAATILFENTAAVFAITLGKEGTMLGFKNSTQIIPSINITPVDTTGAGDAFTGAVLYQLNKKTVDEINKIVQSEWIKIISNANKVGARTCEYMGAMEAFKHLSNNIFK